MSTSRLKSFIDENDDQAIVIHKFLKMCFEDLYEDPWDELNELRDYAKESFSNYMQKRHIEMKTKQTNKGE